MPKYAVQTTLAGNKQLYLRGEREEILVATFQPSPEGNAAYGLFTAGLAAVQGASLFNADSGQYDIGTMGELIG